MTKLEQDGLLALLERVEQRLTEIRPYLQVLRDFHVGDAEDLRSKLERLAELEVAH